MNITMAIKEIILTPYDGWVVGGEFDSSICRFTTVNKHYSGRPQVDPYLTRGALLVSRNCANEEANTTYGWYDSAWISATLTKTFSQLGVSEPVTSIRAMFDYRFLFNHKLYRNGVDAYSGGKNQQRPTYFNEGQVSVGLDLLNSSGTLITSLTDRAYAPKRNYANGDFMYGAFPYTGNTVANTGRPMGTGLFPINHGLQRGTLKTVSIASSSSVKFRLGFIFPEMDPNLMNGIGQTVKIKIYRIHLTVTSSPPL